MLDSWRSDKAPLLWHVATLLGLLLFLGPLVFWIVVHQWAGGQWMGASPKAAFQLLGVNMALTMLSHGPDMLTFFGV